MKRLILSIVLLFAFSGSLFAAAVIPYVGQALPVPDSTVHKTPIMLAWPGTPTWVDAVVLTSNSAASYTIPTGANYLLFSASALFYVSFTGTAVIPTGAVTTGVAPIASPIFVPVGSVASLSFIAPAACVITISVYK